MKKVLKKGDIVPFDGTIISDEDMVVVDAAMKVAKTLYENHEKESSFVKEYRTFSKKEGELA